MKLTVQINEGLHLTKGQKEIKYSLSVFITGLFQLP